MDEIVSIIDKNTREKIFISLRVYKGIELIDIRVFWSPDGKKWNPSKKGVSINRDKLPMVIGALHKAVEMIGAELPPPDQYEEDEFLTIEEKENICKEFNIMPKDITKIIFDQ